MFKKVWEKDGKPTIAFGKVYHSNKHPDLKYIIDKLVADSEINELHHSPEFSKLLKDFIKKKGFKQDENVKFYGSVFGGNSGGGLFDDKGNLYGIVCNSLQVPIHTCQLLKKSISSYNFTN